PKKVKDAKGRIFDYYSERDVREVCEDHGTAHEVPKVNDEGFLILPSDEAGTPERYATKDKWFKYFGIPYNELKKRLKDKKGVTGKAGGNQLYRDAFFPESLIRNLCSDLIVQSEADEKKPKSD